MAIIILAGHIGEDKDAGRTSFLCAEKSGDEWQVVRLP
jgi:hypothetical protein